MKHMKVVLQEKFTAVNSHMRKAEWAQINNLMLKAGCLKPGWEIQGRESVPVHNMGRVGNEQAGEELPHSYVYVVGLREQSQLNAQEHKGKRPDWSTTIPG